MRTIAVMNEKGGTGKTTTTVSLAAVLAERGLRVLIVDLDPQASVSCRMGRGRELGLYRAIAQRISPESRGQTLVDVQFFHNLVAPSQRHASRQLKRTKGQPAANLRSSRWAVTLFT